jgi:hypothetical protein
VKTGTGNWTTWKTNRTLLYKLLRCTGHTGIAGESLWQMAAEEMRVCSCLLRF